MIGWLEASWANVILATVGALVGVTITVAVAEALTDRDDWDISELTGKDGDD